MKKLLCPRCRSENIEELKKSVTDSPKKELLDEDGKSHNHGGHGSTYTLNQCRDCQEEFEVFSYGYCCELYSGERLITWGDMRENTKIEVLK